MEPLTDEQAHQVYTWVDKHALSRPKRNIARDFADGVCVAEILKFYVPQFVDLHNYVSAFSQKQKVENWLTMKQKIFRRINLEVDPKDMTDIAEAVPGAIERFLLVLMNKIPQIQRKLAQQRSASEQQGGGGGGGSAAADDQYQPPARTQHAAAAAAPPSPVRGGGARPGSAATDGKREHAAASGAGGDATVAKDHEITNLRESVRLLTAKIRQLEELLKLRDSKIRDLQAKVVQLSS